ncbi:MAG: T9SS type A sorting domain-containing protein [Saprospiraceae bacterium]
MKHFLTFLVSLLLSFSLLAQNNYPPIIWNSGIATTPSEPDESGIEVLDIETELITGSTYVAARCTAPSSFPNGQTFTPTPNGELLLLIKYNYQGDVDWVKNLGFVGFFSRSTKICTSNLEGVYLTGVFSIPNIDFGNGISINLSCNNSCEDIYLAKFATNGQAQWAKTVSGGDGAIFTVAGIDADNSGNLYLAGNYNSTKANFGSNFIFNNLPQKGFFLANYNASSGNPQAVHFPASGSDIGTLEHLDVNNNQQVVLTGNFSGTIDFGNGLSLTAPPNDFGYFVVGLNTTGTAQWLRNLGPSTSYFIVEGIDMDQEGKVYLAIDASEDLTLDNNPILNTSSGLTAIVLKLTASTHSIPVLIPYNNSVDYPIMDVKLDHWGNIYTTGFITDALNIGGENVPVDGCTDALIIIAGNEGLHQVARSIGGAGCEAMTNFFYGANIVLDDVGFLYGAGQFTNGFAEDGFTLSGSGAFVSKFNTSIVDTDEPKSGAMQISPNPNSGSFSIILEENPSLNALLSIHDLGGREVYRQEIQDLQTNIFTQLPAGAYIACIQDGKSLIRQKLMVQR